MPARDRASAKARRPGTTSRTRDAARDRGRAVGATPSSRRTGRGTPEPERRPAGDGLVVGAVPVLARIAGGLLALAGLVGAAALFPTYLVVGGAEISLATGVGGVLAGLLVPVAHVAVGALLLRRRRPQVRSRPTPASPPRSRWASC